ncbi:MAG: hypothetical protein SWH61_12895 [Thermodesulfobacteriota bacterium]|nr:hypothetical protein [Thermodesulfobacteriota bacterium]
MKRRQKEDYLLENVWGAMTPELTAEVTEFWLKHGALPSQAAAAERARQIFGIGRDQDGAIAGVGTIFERYNQALENSFYYYRTFIAPAHRRTLLATHLIINTRDYLEKAFVTGDRPKCIGMIVEVENEHLKKERNQAVWPYSGFTYIGKNPKGAHVRVYYFEGARIS